jgi:hypothetical protein
MWVNARGLEEQQELYVHWNQDGCNVHVRTHTRYKVTSWHLPAGGAIEAAESDLNNGDVGI